MEEERLFPDLDSEFQEEEKKVEKSPLVDDKGGDGEEPIEVEPQKDEEVAEKNSDEVKEKPPEEKIGKKVVTWGNRALNECFWKKFSCTCSDVWNSKFMVVVAITIVASIFVGANMYSLTEKSSARIVKVEEGKTEIVVPVPPEKASFFSIVGHISILILAFRYIFLSLTKKEDKIEVTLTNTGRRR